MKRPEKSSLFKKKLAHAIALKNTKTETMEADVVVVGAGAAGTAAALSAAEKGVKVIVLEKTPAPGGAGKIASGLFGVESSLQKAK